MDAAQPDDKTATSGPSPAYYAVWGVNFLLLVLSVVGLKIVRDGQATGMTLGPEVGAEAVKAGEASIRQEITVGVVAGGTGTVAQRMLFVYDLPSKRARISSVVGIGQSQISLRGVAGDGFVYYEADEETAVLPDDKRWVKVPGEGPSAVPEDVKTGDDFLDSLGTQRENVGTEDLDGRSTTRWRIAIDPSASQLPKALTDALGSAAPGAAQVTEITVWIDDEGLPRRERIVTTAGGQPVTTQATFSYHKPHTIDLPPDAEVVEATDLQAALPLLGVGATQPTGAGGGPPADVAAQSDLRAALSLEKLFYAENKRYSASRVDIDAMPLAVEMAVSPDGQVVCLTRRSAGGTTFVLADIAQGDGQGQYYGRAAIASCTPDAAKALARSW